MTKPIKRSRARPASSYRGARRNAARAEAKAIDGLKFRDAWASYRTGGAR